MLCLITIAPVHLYWRFQQQPKCLRMHLLFCFVLFCLSFNLYKSSSSCFQLTTEQLATDNLTCDVAWKLLTSSRGKGNHSCHENEAASWQLIRHITKVNILWSEKHQTCKGLLSRRARYSHYRQLSKWLHTVVNSFVIEALLDPHSKSSTSCSRKPFWWLHKRP